MRGLVYKMAKWSKHTLCWKYNIFSNLWFLKCLRAQQLNPPSEYNYYLMQSPFCGSLHQGLFMQERGMLISAVLIMIAGAAGNAGTITISHLLYYYQEASNCFSAPCFGKTSSAMMEDSIYLAPKQRAALRATTLKLQ